MEPTAFLHQAAQKPDKPVDSGHAVLQQIKRGMAKVSLRTPTVMRDFKPHLGTNHSSIQRRDAPSLEEVYFVFDNRIFKPSKLYFQDSPIFQQLFSNTQEAEITGKGPPLKPHTNAWGRVTPQPAISNAQVTGFTGKGTSLDPYSCRGVMPESFASLLRVSLSTATGDSACEMTTQEWVDVLELASRWRMDKVLNTAVYHLNRMHLDPVAKLELAWRHNIQDNEWRLSAIHTLVKDDTQLTEWEAGLIGCGVALKIARIQGMVHVKNKQPFVNSDEEQIMDRLAKERMFEDKWQYPTTLPFLGLQSILGMREALANYCSSLPFPVPWSILRGTRKAFGMLLLMWFISYILSSLLTYTRSLC